MSRREISRPWAYDPEQPREYEYPEPTRLVGHGQARPDTYYAAIMESRPGEEPEPSREQLLPLRDVLADAIEALPAHHRWAFEALVIRRLSQRQLAEEIGRPRRTVRRWKEDAISTLDDVLSRVPEIMEYLNRGRWNE